MEYMSGYVKDNTLSWTYEGGRHRNMRTRTYVKGGAVHDPERVVQCTCKGWSCDRIYRKDCLGLLASKLFQHALN